MMTNRSFVALAASIVIAVACNGAARVAATDGERVTARRASEGVDVTNGTNSTIYLQLSNSGWLGLLASCTAAPWPCATVAPGATLRVPNGDVHGGVSGDVLVSYWLSSNGKAVEPAHQLTLAR
jgi:hypothetical protein